MDLKELKENMCHDVCVLLSEFMQKQFKFYYQEVDIFIEKQFGNIVLILRKIKYRKGSNYIYIRMI